MRERKNIFIGIMFIVIAVFIIVSAMGVFGQIGFWTLVLTPFFVAWLIAGIFKLSWTGILFPVAFLAILYDEMLGIEALTPWPVLLAALFGSLGMNMMFGKHKHHKPSFEFEFSNDKRERHRGKNFEYEYSTEDKEAAKDLFVQMEHSFKSDIAFGNITKYVQCQALEEGVIENGFGSTTIYMDNARLNNGKAIIKVDNAFGEVKLFIPKEWRVLVEIERSLGSCDIYGTCAEESENTLYITGECAFGVIKIHYI